MFRSLAAAALLLALAAAPAPVARYDVTIAQSDLGGGVARGTLDLHVAPSGVVTGFFRGYDDALPRPVTGGLAGDALWFDIGTFRFTGTLGPGGIRGRAFDDAGPVEYELRGEPIAAP